MEIAPAVFNAVRYSRAVIAVDVSNHNEGKMIRRNDAMMSTVADNALPMRKRLSLILRNRSCKGYRAIANTTDQTRMLIKGAITNTEAEIRARTASNRKTRSTEDGPWEIVDMLLRNGCVGSEPFALNGGSAGKHRH